MSSQPSPAARADPSGAQTYDVYFVVTGGGFRIHWRNPNHGLTVDADGLAFTADGSPRRAAWTDIAAVHLQVAALGNAQNIIDQCKIEFADGSAIVVSNAAASGLPSAAQTPVYRDFVRALHAHLAGRADGTTRFTAGMSPVRYKALLVTLVVAGLFFIATPLVLMLVTGDWTALYIAGGGVFLLFPFIGFLAKSAPRAYTPDALPDELLS